MIRALLGLGVKVDFLLLNQSEEKTTSVKLKQRLETHYGSASFSVEVRKHPNYAKKKEGTLLESVKANISRRSERLLYKDALLNNSTALPKNFERAICSALKSQSYDYVWFNYLKVMPSMLPKTGAKIIADMHDKQSDRVRVDVLPTIETRRQKKYFQRFVESEISLINKCDFAISISPVETNKIREDYRPSSSLITLKATDDAKPKSIESFTYDMTFIGSNSAPNVDGLVWFVDEVLPLVAAEIPKVKFLIQGNVNRGKIVKSAIERSRFKKNIVQQGFVESLASVYNLSNLMVCPIRYGTGMKIKVVEAMAYGKAIVGTSVAFEGIDNSFGLTPQDSADGFAQQVLEVLRNRHLARELEKASERTFQEQHSFEALKSTIATLVLDEGEK